MYMDVRANTDRMETISSTVPMNACSKTPLLKCDNMKFDVYTYYTNILRPVHIKDTEPRKARML